jgi:hypothetical protein
VASQFARAQSLVSDERGGPTQNWVGRVGTVVALVQADVEGVPGSATITESFWGPISRARVSLRWKHAQLRLTGGAPPRCATR